MSKKMAIPAGETGLLDSTQKGMPGGVEPFPVDEIGAKGWNVLAEDLPLGAGDIAPCQGVASPHALVRLVHDDR